MLGPANRPRATQVMSAQLDPVTFDDSPGFDVIRFNADTNSSFGFGCHYRIAAARARYRLRCVFFAFLSAVGTLEIDDSLSSMKTAFIGRRKLV